MYQEVSMQWSNRIRRLAITLVASAAIGTQGASAGSSNNIVLVPPAGLPELARKAGEAMFLREAHDGRTVLYIEQDQGTALATFGRKNDAPRRGGFAGVRGIFLHIRTGSAHGAGVRS